MAPCKITQFHYQATVALYFQIPSVLSVYFERIAIEFVQKNKLINTEYYASRKRTIMAMCRMNGKRTYVSLKHIAILTTN